MTEKPIWLLATISVMQRWWSVGLLALSVVVATAENAGAQSQAPGSAPLTSKDVQKPTLPYGLQPPRRSTPAAKLPSAIQPAPRWCAELLATNPKPTYIVDLYERVREAIEPKGEFETTAAFRKRAEAALPALKDAIEKRSGSSLVVVVAPVLSRYDADKSRFSIGSAYWPITGYMNDLRDKSFSAVDYELLAVETHKTDAGQYEGQNAYGVKKTIFTETSIEYGVALVDLSRTKGKDWLKGEFFLAMTPDRAAAINGKLSVVVAGELDAAGAIEGSDHVSPTMNRPFEKEVTKRYVAIKNTCGAIIATSTGELLHRLN